MSENTACRSICYFLLPGSAPKARRPPRKRASSGSFVRNELLAKCVTARKAAIVSGMNLPAASPRQTARSSPGFAARCHDVPNARSSLPQESGG